MQRCTIVLLVVFSSLVHCEICKPSSSIWRKLDDSQILLALDYHATYLTFKFIPPDEDLALRIVNVYPHARYISFTTYDAEANPVDTIYDYNMIRNSGNKFSVVVKSINATVPSNSGNGNNQDNYINRPPASIKGITVWYRIYVLNGKVSYPQIEAFSISTGESRPCPIFRHVTSPVDLKQMSISHQSVPPTPLVGQIFDFVRIIPLGMYANAQNGYLSRTFNFTEDEAVIIKFRLPVSSTSYDVYKPDSSWSTSDMRYYSISITTLLQSTEDTLDDIDLLNFATQEDDTTVVNILVSYPNLVLERWASLNGYGHLSFTEVIDYGGAALAYRNQAVNSGFEGNANKVPACTPTLISTSPQTCYASQYVGSYAPVGIICPITQLLSGSCTL